MLAASCNACSAPPCCHSQGHRSAGPVQLSRTLTYSWLTHMRSLSHLAAGEGKQLTPMMALGFAGALIGFCGYSHAKLEASMIRPEKAALQPGTRPDKAASMEEGGLEKELLKPIKSIDGTRGQRIKIVHCTA